jgi:hypothetical protein
MVRSHGSKRGTIPKSEEWAGAVIRERTIQDREGQEKKPLQQKYRNKH